MISKCIHTVQQTSHPLASSTVPRYSLEKFGDLSPRAAGPHHRRDVVHQIRGHDVLPKPVLLVAAVPGAVVVHAEAGGSECDGQIKINGDFDRKSPDDGKLYDT